MKKFIQISLALLTGLTAAVAIMLKSDLVSNNLLQRIKAVAWIELGQELEVEELEVSLIPLGSKFEASSLPTKQPRKLGLRLVRWT